MQENLEIIITANSSGANRNISNTERELEKLKKKTEETQNKISETMASIKRGVTVALASVTALVAGMGALGRSATENQKSIGRLISSFQALGSSAKQATKTYTQLFGFLGDSGTATEAANLLAQITTNTKDLEQWTKILQGVYATFPDSLPVEALAEATNETIKVGQVTGNLADAVNWLGVSEDAVNAQLAQLNTTQEREAYLRSLLNGLYGQAAEIYAINNAEMIAYNQSQAKLSATLAQLSKTLTPVLTAFNNVATVLLTSLAPAIEWVSAAIVVFCEWIAKAVAWVGAFFGVSISFGNAANNIGKVNTGLGKMNNQLESGVASANALKKATMGFDELNVVPSNSGSGGASVSGGGGAIDVPQIDTSAITSGVDQFKQKIAEVKEEIQGVLVLVGLVAIGLLAWKIAEFVTGIQNGTLAMSVLLDKLKFVGGIMLIIAGALLLIKGYSDAWANGIDWENFALILGGIGLIVGGVTLAFGALAGAIATIIGGVALVVLGIKDLVTNGYSMQGVLTVLVGVILLIVGALWAFNAALLANPITWVVIAILALVATFVILWNECEGFRNFWINLWDNIKKAFKAVWEWLKQAAIDIGNFFVDAWEFIKDAWSACGDFFSGIWEGIKNAFGAVGTWFKDTFTKAWEGVKNVFSTGGKIFDGIKSGISNVFTTVVNGLIGGINKVIAVPFNKINSILNWIRGIEVAGFKPFKDLWGYNPLSVPQIPKLAKGGITMGNTIANIGEDGYTEAVLPLERNTEWMDVLAERIANRNSAPSRIVLMVDGKELGYAAINGINGITQQTGSLQLRMI